MMKYILLLLIPLVVMSCGNKAIPMDEQSNTDSTVVMLDTLVSDVNWSQDLEYEENQETYTPSKKHARSSSKKVYKHSTRTQKSADSNADVLKYQTYTRVGDRPKDFAKALIYPAIRMVYSDNFSKPNVQVLNATEEGVQQIIDVSITWEDRWIEKYRIDGTLKVNQDGSNATFVITDKNINAEVLELTEDNTQTKITLPTL